MDSSADRSVATSGLLAARKGFTNLPVSGAKPIANIANGQRTRCAPANFLHVGLVPGFDLEKLLHASLASQAFLFLRWRLLALLARTRVVGQLVCLADLAYVFGGFCSGFGGFTVAHVFGGFSSCVWRI